MKTKLTPLLLMLTLGLFIQCQHEDQVPQTNDSNITRGSDVVDITAGYTFDKAHSSVRWETAYKGTGALLTGRFNEFGITTFKFVEDDASQISIEGWVRLNTVNTGEPGRDGGCLIGTFGTDLTFVDEPENLAIFKSTGVELSSFDTGYIVTAELTFHGVTLPVTLKLDYTGTTFYDGTTPYFLSGFSGEFDFLAQTDYVISSTSISDKVTVKINTQFKKNQ